MPLPFYTIAGRIVHYGRYGSGSDDPRLYPLYIDNPAFVRGYRSYDYASECVSAAPTGCAASDTFAGSRMLAANLELRFPILRPFGISRRMYGIAVPTEVALFADGGVAWTGRDRPALLGGTRAGIGSAGIAVRLAPGALVAEIDVARPFQQPERGWTFGFNLIPA
jgi:outer membrane protein assembly factor BamA